MIKVTIAEGYHGSCGKCLKDDNQDQMVKEWVEFSEPVPANPVLGLPEVKGIFHMVHEYCRKEDR